MADPVARKNADFYSGWHSMQIEFMLRTYIQQEKQLFVNDYLSSLRPEIATEMVRAADDLFPPNLAAMVKQYKEEWDAD